MAKILIVDDDPGCRKILRASLESLHHEVHEARNGSEVLSTYFQLMPDLILLDTFMPVKDGIETLVELRTHKCIAPVVVMSDGGAVGGGRYSGTVFEAMKMLGAAATLLKPFGLEELTKTIETALTKSQNLSQNHPQPEIGS